jgi:hypothetical protein
MLLANPRAATNEIVVASGIDVTWIMGIDMANNTTVPTTRMAPVLPKVPYLWLSLEASTV